MLKHIIWLMIAWWTGGAWVLYFPDAPILVHDLATFQATAIAYIWIGILTASTYLLAGYMREQVCVYMCPWPRIQAALTDEWPSMSPTSSTAASSAAHKSFDLRARGERVGDCIDCNPVPRSRGLRRRVQPRQGEACLCHQAKDAAGRR